MQPRTVGIRCQLHALTLYFFSLTYQMTQSHPINISRKIASALTTACKTKFLN